MHHFSVPTRPRLTKPLKELSMRSPWKFDPLLGSLTQLSVGPLLLACLLALSANATTYYVDRQIGKDTNTGLSQISGANGPLYSIRAALNKPLVGGDIVEIKPTGTYTESLVLSKSGQPGKPIIIRGFGYPNAKRPLIKFTDTSLSARFELIAPSRSVVGWVTIQGLEITNSPSSPIKYSYGDNLIIQGNYIHDCVGSLLGTSGFQVTIDGNLLVNSGSATHGMYITGQQNKITNNLIVGAKKYGIQTAGYQQQDGPDPKYGNFKKNLIANNTIAYCGSSGIVIWGADYTGPAFSNDDNDIVNNLFYENATDSSSANGIRIMQSGKQTIGNRIKNNLSYGTSPGPTRFVLAGAGKLFTLSNNLPTTDPENGPKPLLVDAPSTYTGNYDFHLTAGSPAINKGLNLASLGVTTDFEGKPRPASGAFDIGAFQAASGGALPTPSAPNMLIVK